jgi:Domain of unknown function (DUF4272)
MKRATILKYVFVRALAAPPTDQLKTIMSQWSPEERSRFAADFGQMFMRDMEHLKSTGLWPDVEADERKFLEAGVDQISQQQRIDASWLAESIVTLLWALRIVPELPAYDQEVNHETVKLLPTTSIPDLVRQARLRPESDIRKQRGIAELWHWRSRTRRLQEEGRLNGRVVGGRTIEQIIELAATKGAENGDLPAPIGSDFPAFGKPYRGLSDEEFAILTSISQERHKALNWLCGLSPTRRWADTPTDT